jgi:hypothetical protein
MFEIIFSIIWIMIIYGCFGALVEFVLNFIKKLGGKK